MAADAAKGEFGSCCDNLREAMQSEDFEPLISTDDDGVLYMSVGLLGPDEEDEDANTIDYPVFFCPFCGTKLQTPEDIDGKTNSSN